MDDSIRGHEMWRYAKTGPLGKHNNLLFEKLIILNIITIQMESMNKAADKKSSFLYNLSKLYEECEKKTL